MSLAWLSGCASFQGSDGGAEDGADGGASIPAGALTISPNPLLVTAGTELQQQSFTVTSSSAGDVTGQAQVVLADPSAGDPSGGVFKPSAGLSRGLRTRMTATYGPQAGSAEVEIRFLASTVGDGVLPSDPSLYFTGNPTGALPAWAYPLRGAMMPRNFPTMNLQYRGTADALLYRVRLECDLFTQTLYLGGSLCDSGACQYEVPGTKWLAFSNSCADSSARLTVVSSPGIGKPTGSDALTVSFSPEELKGGLSYFSSGIQGIYHMPAGAAAPTVFVANGNGQQCAGCHAVSRDGKKVALTFTTISGPGGVVDGRNGKQYLLPAGTLGSWNFATFNPGGDQLMLNFRSKLWVVNPDTGARLFEVPPAALGPGMAQPDWSPDGQSIAAVQTSDFTEYQFRQIGDLVVMPFNGGKFGLPDVVLAGQMGTQIHYYPAWTPDSKWLLFNSCLGNCNSYNALDTKLRMILAKPGSQPIDLTNAQQQANSGTNYPRPSPFLQRGRLMFIAFGSRAPYGVVKPRGTSQIWAAAIDLEKAASQPGADPSYAPFIISGQNIANENNMPMWTTSIGCLQNSDCSTGFGCVSEQCVPSLN